MAEFSGFSFLKLIYSTQIPDKPSQKKISPNRTSRFSFLNAFKKVAQQKPIVRQINNPQKSRIIPQNELQTTKSKPVLRPVNAPETLSKPVTNPIITSETPKSEPVIQPTYELQINELQTSQTLQTAESKPVITITPINGDGNDNTSGTTSSDRVIRPGGNTSETSQTDGPKIYPRKVEIPVPVLSQSFNGCGAAAWAMVMSYFENWTGNPPQWYSSYDIGLDPYTLREKG